ncbi:hypothetical protein M1739_23590, partial [Salmonella enterica subsp. enterica serovar Abaetetuba]|nr:hypothetical protein [Salmonella enterica subsp. enterica serovar Abaetetuba]
PVDRLLKMPALAADYVRAGSETPEAPPVALRQVPTIHIVTTSRILTRETRAKTHHQALPGTEKRSRPGPKGRNNIAFNAG